MSAGNAEISTAGVISDPYANEGLPLAPALNVDVPSGDGGAAGLATAGAGKVDTEHGEASGKDGHHMGSAMPSRAEESTWDPSDPYSVVGSSSGEAPAATPHILAAGCAASEDVAPQALRTQAGQESPLASVACTRSAKSTAASTGRPRATSNGSLGEVADELVSFNRSEMLLRGTGLATVMHGCARVLASSKGSAATYELSRPVKQIGTFISHNWSVPRHEKFIAMAVHFNLGIAAAVTSVAMGVIVMLHAASSTPAVTVAWAHYPRGILCKLLFTPIFLWSLLLCREVWYLLGSKEPTVFLDKTCIHQTDSKLQRQGIAKLGAFLRHSKSMLVLYTEVYLVRLWTIYELAAFVVLHDVEGMTFLPTRMALVLVVGLICTFVANVMTILIESWLQWFYAWHACMACMGYGLLLCMRAWGKEQIALQARLANFDVRNCACQCEDDRPVVYHNICTLMRGAQLADEKASDEEALTAFNQRVRDVLPQALSASIGNAGIHYVHALVFAANAVMPYALDVFVEVWYGFPMRKALLLMGLFYGVGATCNIPLVFAFWMSLARCCPHLDGLQEQALILAVFIAGCAVIAGMSLGWHCLYEYGLDSVGGVCAYIFAGFCSAFLTRLAYRGPNSPELAAAARLYADVWNGLGAASRRPPHSRNSQAREGVDGSDAV